MNPNCPGIPGLSRVRSLSVFRKEVFDRAVIRTNKWR